MIEDELDPHGHLCQALNKVPVHVQELVPEECLDPEGICDVDLSQDAYHYEIRSTGCLKRLTLPAIGAYGLAYQLDTVLDRVYRAEQHLTWGPDDLQLDWVPVTLPHPGRFDILMLHIKHNETWRCVLVKLDEQHYAHCSKSTTNRNENRSYCMGYDKKSSLLGPGLPGSSAEGCVVCVLMVFKKCDKGCWHPPAQFKLRNEHGRPPQCDAECMQTLFGARSIHLKCRPDPSSLRLRGDSTASGMHMQMHPSMRQPCGAHTGWPADCPKGQQQQQQPQDMHAMAVAGNLDLASEQAQHQARQHHQTSQPRPSNMPAAIRELGSTSMMHEAPYPAAPHQAAAPRLAQTPHSQLGQAKRSLQLLLHWAGPEVQRLCLQGSLQAPPVTEQQHAAALAQPGRRGVQDSWLVSCKLRGTRLSPAQVLQLSQRYGQPGGALPGCVQLCTHTGRGPAEDAAAWLEGYCRHLLLAGDAKQLDCTVGAFMLRFTRRGEAYTVGMLESLHCWPVVFQLGHAGLCSLWLQESSLLGESCPKAFLLAFDAGGNGRALATQAIPEQDMLVVSGLTQQEQASAQLELVREGCERVIVRHLVPTAPPTGRPWF